MRTSAQDAPPANEETSRLSASEIFDRVTRGARDEVHRPVHNLAWSAVAAGLTMGLSGLAVAVLADTVGADHRALVVAGYPLGFLVVILGRQQLFTENTLFPVALALEEHTMLRRTARLWLVVLAGNVLGALAFAVLAVRTSALPSGVRDQLVRLGVETTAPGITQVFWSAVIAGWLIALVAWLVTASTDTTAQILVVLLLTYVVGLAHFAHSVAGTAEALGAVVDGSLGLGGAAGWFAAAVAGNAVGGVVMVALLNYGQVHGQTGGGAHADG